MSRHYISPRIRLLAVMACLACLLTGTGCAQNTLRLTYPAPGNYSVPSAAAPSVCVVTFFDGRDKTAIGAYRDGTPITTSASVTAWLAHALADELAAQGFIVSYASSLEQAIAAAPGRIVMGDVDTVWLQESGLTRYSCVIHCTLSLLSGEGLHQFRTRLSSTVSRSTLPLIGNGEAALTEAAVEFARPAARLIGEKLR